MSSNATHNYRYGEHGTGVLMTSEEYLAECGWSATASSYRALIGDTRQGHVWTDPKTGRRYRDESIDDAVAIQLKRDQERFCFVVERMEEANKCSG